MGASIRAISLVLLCVGLCRRRARYEQGSSCGGWPPPPSLWSPQDSGKEKKHGARRRLWDSQTETLARDGHRFLFSKHDAHRWMLDGDWDLQEPGRDVLSSAPFCLPPGQQGNCMYYMIDRPPDCSSVSHSFEPESM